MFVWSLWTTSAPCYTEFRREHNPVPARGGTRENHEIHHKSCCHPGAYHRTSVWHQDDHPIGTAGQYRQSWTAPCNRDDRALGRSRHCPCSARHRMAPATSSIPDHDPCRHGGQPHPCHRLLACYAQGLQTDVDALARPCGRRSSQDGIPVLRHWSDRWHTVRSAARCCRVHQILIQLASVRDRHYRRLPLGYDSRPYQATGLILELHAKHDTPRMRGVVMHLLVSSRQHSQTQFAERPPATAS